MLIHLRVLGFNRVSFGIQDFNDEVQQAVNRTQQVDTVKALITKPASLALSL